MTVDVSFVIPVLNEEAAVADLLRDLRARYPGSQLIVVDGGSHDRTVSLALPLCDQLLMSDSGRATTDEFRGAGCSYAVRLFSARRQSPRRLRGSA